MSGTLAPFEARSILCWINRRSGKSQAGSILSWLNLSGVQKHDGDVVLNRVNTAADAAFQAFPVGMEDYRLLAVGANQNV